MLAATIAGSNVGSEQPEVIQSAFSCTAEFCTSPQVHAEVLSLSLSKILLGGCVTAPTLVHMRVTVLVLLVRSAIQMPTAQQRRHVVAHRHESEIICGP